MGSKEVVVLDSNVLVSALGWRGPEWKVYRACREGRLQMATSPALLEELTRVLAYPKFEFTEEEITAFEADIRTHARIISPTRRLHVISDDPADNEVLECALVANAPWIVSGDPHLRID